MNTLLDRIGLFSQTRWPWLVIAILSAGLVLIAHNVFQVWLYMKPCEQCVYIRFAFLCMTFGCLFTLAWPKAHRLCVRRLRLHLRHHVLGEAFLDSPRHSF